MSTCSPSHWPLSRSLRDGAPPVSSVDIARYAHSNIICAIPHANVVAAYVRRGWHCVQGREGGGATRLRVEAPRSASPCRCMPLLPSRSALFACSVLRGGRAVSLHSCDVAASFSTHHAALALLPLLSPPLVSPFVANCPPRRTHRGCVRAQHSANRRNSLQTPSPRQCGSFLSPSSRPHPLPCQPLFPLLPTSAVLAARPHSHPPTPHPRAHIQPRHRAHECSALCSPSCSPASHNL